MPAWSQSTWAASPRQSSDQTYLLSRVHRREQGGRHGIRKCEAAYAEFIGAPGEVFPFTYLRGPVGPQDMNYPKYPLPPWPLPYMHTPWRFFDGLDNDLIGYIFPRGNDAGVPGQHVASNPTASGTDRFGCGHSDDSEAVNDRAGDIVGKALVGILAQHAASPERTDQGRYVLRDGRLAGGRGR